jgi:hypothetical protein
VPLPSRCWDWTSSFPSNVIVFIHKLRAQFAHGTFDFAIRTSRSMSTPSLPFAFAVYMLRLPALSAFQRFAMTVMHVRLR